MSRRIVGTVVPLIKIMLIVWLLLLAVLYTIDRLLDVLPKGLFGQILGYSIALTLLSFWLATWYKLTKIYFWENIKKYYKK
ncbi:MAG: hypothetical protein DRJ52_04155 [Thermoprotei archaeon]|nr:MAG: hypothetical protein DRJ52_04155 [Thermoprotei archaeon]RLF00720.1 MAG: hypothetical protein DRJ63_01600 [Thermoprotei archaeon]